MGDRELEKYFGDMIRTKRNTRNITQEHLAGRVGISVDYIRGIERGTYSVNWIIWLKICKVLDLDVNDLMKNCRTL